jgi:hypothetical protein
MGWFMAFTTFISHDLNQKSISGHVKLLIATHLGLFEGGLCGYPKASYLLIVLSNENWAIRYYPLVFNTPKLEMVSYPIISSSSIGRSR